MEISEECEELIGKSPGRDLLALSKEIELLWHEGQRTYPLQLGAKIVLNYDVRETDCAGSVHEGKGYWNIWEPPERYLGHGQLVVVDVDERIDDAYHSTVVLTTRG